MKLGIRDWGLGIDGIASLCLLNEIMEITSTKYQIPSKYQ